MLSLALNKPSQETVRQEVYKCWVIRIKIPTFIIPCWVINTVEILGFILFVGLANGVIG